MDKENLAVFDPRRTEWPAWTQDDPVEGAAEQRVVDQHGMSRLIRRLWFTVRNAMEL